jgi:DNA-binding NtrC family response regulator
LLIIDAYVADISGHDAAIYLSKKSPNMKVLMVAGLPDDQRMEALTTDESFAVFPKPFPPADLVAKVSEVLNMK